MHSLKCNLYTGIIKLVKVKSAFRLKEDELKEFIEKRNQKILAPKKKMYKKYSILCKKVQNHECYKIAPKENKSKKKVLFIHGGAYCLEADHLEWGMVYSIVDQTNATVYFPRYPLAPENNCTKAFEMIMELYKNLIKTNKPEDITIIGDSAGGGIVLSLAMMIRDCGLLQPANLVLISPALEISAESEGNEEYIEYLEKRDPMISLPGLGIICEWWRGKYKKTDYQVSPRYGNFQNLAPITLFSSKTEVLNVFVKLFLKDAKKQGVNVEYHEKQDMIHCWVLSNFKESYKDRERVMELIRGC